jgi:Glycosyltransferase family 87
MDEKVPLRFYCYALFFIPASILPIFLTTTHLPFVGNTYGDSYTNFELLGFSGSVWLILTAWHDFTKRAGTTAEKLTVIIPLVLTGLFFLMLFVEYSAKSPDYSNYEQGSIDMLEEKNPYLPKRYIYPPFLGQLMGVAFLILRYVGIAIKPGVSDITIWNLVFYFYQCMQFFLIVMGFWLCYRIVRVFCKDRFYSVLLVTALLIFNNPLIRSIRHNQVNILVLDLLMLTILFATKRPWLSGAVNSIACHIKLYPFVLFIPWIIQRRWRPIIATVFAFSAIVVLQLGTKNGIQFWFDFLTFFGRFPQTDYFRDNSVHSVIYNFLNFLTFPLQIPGGKLLLVTQIYSFVIAIGLVILFSFRWHRIASEPLLEKTERLEKNMIPLLESLPLILLISPLVWEHHYVLVIPYSLWLLTRKNVQQNGLAFLGTFLVFAIPTFDLFPFSFNRITGLVLMLWAGLNGKIEGNEAKTA